MNRTDFLARLRAINACTAALTWIGQTPGEPADLWAACPRGDWLLWLLVAVGYDERTMRHIACDCAEGVLPIYERAYPGDRRPRDAIAVARRYADGEATEEERNAVWDAAWAVAKSADWTAAKSAAYAVAWAASGDAAWAASNAATEAASSAAAKPAAWARQADMVRARVSWADVEALLAQKGGGDGR